MPSFLVQPHKLIGSCNPQGHNDGSNNTDAWPEGHISEVLSEHRKTWWFIFSSTPKSFVMENWTTPAAAGTQMELRQFLRVRRQLAGYML